MAMITLKEYAERLGKPRNTVYRKYQNGYLKGAIKMGRDIWIDENEPYIDARVKTGRYVGWHRPKRLAQAEAACPRERRISQEDDTMKRIEYADLRALGASDMALDFYNGTEPLTIQQNADGTYVMRFAYDPPISYATAAELIADLDAMAKADEIEA